MKCPVCGGAVEGVSVEALRHIGFTRKERRILETLVKAYPGDIRTDQLVDAMYWDDREGGPLKPENTAHAIMWKMRKKLSVFGWSISKNGAGRGVIGHYHLYKTETCQR